MRALLLSESRVIRQAANFGRPEFSQTFHRLAGGFTQNLQLLSLIREVGKRIKPGNHLLA
jgi:hypothetical protein